MSDIRRGTHDRPIAFMTLDHDGCWPGCRKFDGLRGRAAYVILEVPKSPAAAPDHQAGLGTL